MRVLRFEKGKKGEAEAEKSSAFVKRRERREGRERREQEKKNSKKN